MSHQKKMDPSCWGAKHYALFLEFRKYLHPRILKMLFFQIHTIFLGSFDFAQNHTPTLIYLGVPAILAYSSANTSPQQFLILPQAGIL
jgi:hypothetical protein